MAERRREPERRGRESKGKAAEQESGPPRELLIRGVGAAAVGLLLPGLGHAWLGRLGRGAILFGCIAVMLALGLANEGGLATPRPGEPLTYLAAFGNLGLGPAYFVLRAMGAGTGSPDHPTYEYGTTFILSAGLLNFLLVLDAYDIAVGNRK